MKLLRPFFLVLLLLLPAPVWAGNASPALWVVRDEDTTIYLFGTVHVLKPGLNWFDGPVKQAFERSQEVKLEMVTPPQDAMQALMLKSGFATDGPALTEKLPEDKRAAFTKAVADLGQPVAFFDRTRPWLAATLLSVLPLAKLGYDPADGAEQVITAAAKAENKPITGLETAEQQIGFLSGLPEAVQIRFLVNVVDDLPKIGAETEEMVADWAKGDPDSLAALLNRDLQTLPELTKALLTDRNARWADWIADRMHQPGTVFIAVGAGHLAGENSVLTFLDRKHLKVERLQ